MREKYRCFYILLICILFFTACSRKSDISGISVSSDVQSVSSASAASSDFVRKTESIGIVQDDTVLDQADSKASSMSNHSVLYGVVSDETDKKDLSVSSSYVSSNSVSSDTVSDDSVSVNDHIEITLDGSGQDIFIPRRSGTDYRYGPSIISDGEHIDIYFAAPGDGSSELDFISYRHSDDNGKTWSDEKVVLTPTPLSKDRLSVCDPDVFYFDGYYYLGYTATMDVVHKGYENNVFVARSKNPDGPFEKWNGHGWGGNPEPLIYYDGMWNGWGAGEPCFVVNDSDIYIYCTYDGYDRSNVRVRSTAVYKADMVDDWPDTLRFKGYAVNRTDGSSTVSGDDYVYSDSDSWDVAYFDKYKKFVAVAVNKRFKPDSSFVYYESEDGVSFDRLSDIHTNVCAGAHNIGLMSDREGHANADTRVAYAYGGKDNQWGVWAVRSVPVSLSVSDDVIHDGGHNLDVFVPKDSSSDRKLMQLKSSSLVWSLYKGTDFVPVISYFDGSSSHNVSLSDVTFSGYDEDIIKIDAGKIHGKSTGSTSLTVSYKGINRIVAVNVYLPGTDIVSGGLSLMPERTYAPRDEYNVSLSDEYAVTIRPLISYKDYSIMEIPFENVLGGTVKFVSLDSGVCTVRTDGIIDPVSKGDTDIILYMSGVPFDTVKIIVGD